MSYRLDEELPHSQLFDAYQLLAHHKCPICGASPRTGVCFTDDDNGDVVAYAACTNCNHAERL